MAAQTRFITVAAMAVTDPVGWVLCAHRWNTDTSMLLGDKLEPGESVDNSEVTATHEVPEELGVNIELSQLHPWDIARAAVANETDFEIVSHHVRYADEFTDELANVQPHVGIEEVCWLNPWLPTGKTAPMLAETVLPKFREELPQLITGREQPQRALSSLTALCSPGFGSGPAWRVTAERLGQILAENRVEPVYGGAAIDLMGTVANTSLNDGGSVTDVVPEALVKEEIARPWLTYLETVATTADRRSRMYELGSAFVALPGGMGTLEEFFEVQTQQHLGIHAKPVALLGPPGFWGSLPALLCNVVDAGFVRPGFFDALIVADDVDKLLPALIVWRVGWTKSQPASRLYSAPLVSSSQLLQPSSGAIEDVLVHVGWNTIDTTGRGALPEDHAPPIA